MKKAKASPAEAPAVATEENPFLDAYKLQISQMLDARFARKALLTAMVAIGLCAVQVPVTGFLAWHVANPPVKYFATNYGTLLEIHPTNIPAYKDDDVVAFGEKVIQDAFRLDFKNYRAQISAMQQKFSEEGFISYYNALTSSNPFKAVTEDKMLMSPMISRKGIIKKRGNMGGTGIYAWEIQYPVTLSLDGQQRSLRPQEFVFILRIQRTDVRQKPEGIEIASIVTRAAS